MIFILFGFSFPLVPETHIGSLLNGKRSESEHFVFISFVRHLVGKRKIF